MADADTEQWLTISLRSEFLIALYERLPPLRKNILIPLSKIQASKCAGRAWNLTCTLYLNKLAMCSHSPYTAPLPDEEIESINEAYWLSTAWHWPGGWRTSRWWNQHRISCSTGTFLSLLHVCKRELHYALSDSLLQPVHIKSYWQILKLQL